MLTVRRALTESEHEEARVLIEGYARSLGFDLEFQRFRDELEVFPGEYSPPAGCVLLAESEGRVAGCGCLRPLSDDVCEMKRLYVVPEARGLGAGRALALALVDEARRLGYVRIRLDTVASMAAANALYRSMGFREIEPYRHNPLDDALFFELTL
jgi:putative acetyltransferase